MKSHENQGKQLRRLDDAPVFDMKRKQEPTQASNSKSSLQLVLISDTHGFPREGLDLLLGALPRVTRLCHQPATLPTSTFPPWLTTATHTALREERSGQSPKAPPP